ncbi:hypothetical protein [Humibacter sp. RRB41]|uniref:hypothetical protein n=1 Tax=Humibacter sp. RRB41 TaxID=2919946 RepID=UPI001FA9E37C|nr:hypothetical protein [Humibacter sp. RRB41]
MSDAEESDESDLEGATPESSGDPQNDRDDPGEVAVSRPWADPFAGLDVGRIMPSIDFSKFAPTIDMSAYLPKLDFSKHIPKLDPAIFGAIAKLDFGMKPVIDAAVLKSLGNLVNTKSMFPTGFFQTFADYKFPELNRHAETVRAIDELSVPSRSTEIERIDEVVDAEIVDDEPGTDIDPVIGLTFQAQHLAMQQRTVELLEQSLEANIEANQRADAERANARRSNRLNVGFLIAGLVIAVIGIVVGVFVAR